MNSRGPEPDFGSTFRRSFVEADDIVVTSVGIDDSNPHFHTYIRIPSAPPSPIPNWRGLVSSVGFLSSSALALVRRKIPDSNATSSTPTGSPHHTLSYSPPPLSPEARPKSRLVTKSTTCRRSTASGVHQSGQRTAQETLAQAGERPSSRVLERRRPMAVYVTSADGLVEQSS